MNVQELKDGATFALRAMAIVYAFAALRSRRGGDMEESTNRLAWANLLLLVAMV